ncbi:MAG: hypothetical protein CM1200mP13_05610 [Candidatus Pelagibacterales bacterium]|nr:MAG: hypothetical protein CM1200mP13_05610 [Pelagibacterales bacterium]
MFENIDIRKLKKSSKISKKNYKENFAKIEKFIENEIQEILKSQKKQKNLKFSRN